MTHPKVFFNPERTKKDGSATVYLLVHIDGKTLRINTGISTDPTTFDYTNNRIPGKSQQVKDDKVQFA
jgi:hypothetical protein